MKKPHVAYEINGLPITSEERNTDQNITTINNLSLQLQNILSIYNPRIKNEFVFESEGVFKDICDKAKSSAGSKCEKSDKEKLCYMVAVFILKSGLFFLLEKLYKEGLDLSDF